MPRATAFTRADISARARIVGGFSTAIPTDLTDEQEAELLENLVKERIAEAVRRKTDAFTPETFKPLSYVIRGDRHSECLDAINLAFRCYKLDIVAFAQEHPARIVAALTRVQHALTRSSKEFREELARLPMALGQELGIGDLQHFVNRLAERITYWQRHVRPNRPAEKMGALEADSDHCSAGGRVFARYSCKERAQAPPVDGKG